MGNYNFEEDLQKENETIEKITKALIKRGYEILQVNHTKDYDLKLKTYNLQLETF